LSGRTYSDPFCVFFVQMTSAAITTDNRDAKVNPPNHSTWMTTQLDSETTLYTINSDEKKTVHEWLEFLGVAGSYHFGWGAIMTQGVLPLITAEELAYERLSNARGARNVFYHYPFAQSDSNKTANVTQIAVTTTSNYEKLSQVYVNKKRSQTFCSLVCAFFGCRSKAE